MVQHIQQLIQSGRYTEALPHILQLLQSGHHGEALQLVSGACAANTPVPDYWLLLSTYQIQINDLNGAIDSFMRVLALQPNHGVARYNLAVSLQSLQRNAEALEHYQTLLSHDPGNVAALINLGTLLLEADQAQQAMQPLRTAVTLAPGSAAAHNTLGLVLDRLNQRTEAQSHFRTAVALDSDLASARCNLARSLHLQGDSVQAAAELEALLEQHPDFADAHLLMARILRDSGEPEATRQRLEVLSARSDLSAATHFDIAVEFAALDDTAAAIRHYEAVIALQPNHARALNNLGSLYHREKRAQQALALLVRAGEAAPQLREVQVNLAMMHWEMGHEQAALKHCLEALRLAAGRRDTLQRFARILGGSRQFQVGAELFAAIQACLDDPGIDQQNLVSPGLSILLAEPAIEAVFARCGRGELPAWKTFPSLLQGERGRLLARLMQNTVLARPVLERTLRAARRAALLELTGSDGRLACTVTPDETLFLAALAHQCFNNEFAYGVSVEERERLACLEPVRAVQGDALTTLALILALYGPLASNAGAGILEQALRNTDVQAVRQLVTRHFDNPRVEVGLREEIRDLTPITDATSQAVRDQYEASPYPRWLSVFLLESHPYPAPLRDMFTHFTPPDFGTSRIRTLIAGCGTGKHAVQSATRFRGSEVTAVDLSLGSLAYGLRMSRELGVEAIDFYRGDILDLHGLNTRFHIIESVGVLHHLRDPEAGLRSLRSLLAPNGLMNLGLYSSLARRAVYAAREHYRVAGGWSDLDAIRVARDEILALPDDHPLHGILGMEDFFSLSDCRDLLFHVQERSYRLPEIGDLLDRTGLRFIGFEFADPNIRRDYAREYPGDPDATDLESWDRFEQRHPDTFTGMYVFWCQAVDAV